ncbi:MAG: Wzz/FepE/Etk N-terminal domain-containing protein, partial [Bacteroidales bacterium]|nr:Wzz/FepE/Etk N-terminal domain-containing protein [Bacteroidales bacterium]
KFRRTEFMAVSVVVLDKDPKMAADIANKIAALYDSTCVQMQKDRAMQALKIVEQTYFGLVNEIKTMEDSLAVLRSLGVNDYETQSEMVNQQLVIEIAKNNTQGIKELQKQIEILAKYGTPYVSIRDQLDYDKLQLSLVKAKYEEAKIDAEEELPQKFIVSDAFVAEKKSYPIRWLIVVLSTFAAAFMTMLVLVAVDKTPSLSSLLSNDRKSRDDDNNQPPSSQDPNPAPTPIPEPEAAPKPKVETAHNDNPLPKVEPSTFESITDKKKKEQDNKQYQQLLNELQIEKDMNNFFAANKLWNVIWKRKYHIIILVVVGFLAGAIFSGSTFITPKYKSVGVVYPSNIYEYSEESPTEQLMQWFNSYDIKEEIIEKYNLYDHYGIARDANKAKALMMYTYGKNVKIEQTVYEAVSITVLDKDPQMACDMVNSIIEFVNQRVRTTQHEKFEEVIHAFAKTYEWRMETIDSLSNALEESGIDVKLIGDMSGAKGKLQAYPSAMNPADYSNVLQLTTQNVSMIQFLENYDLAYTDLSREYTHTNIVSSPFPADKKTTPVRWVIVVLSGLAMFLLSYIAFLIVENVNDKKTVK